MTNFLIPAVIRQIFVVAELVIPSEIPTKQAKAEIETHTVTAEAGISKCSVYFKILQNFSLLFTY